jgi:hypothetical protein
LGRFFNRFGFLFLGLFGFWRFFLRRLLSVYEALNRIETKPSIDRQKPSEKKPPKAKKTKKEKTEPVEEATQEETEPVEEATPVEEGKSE